MKVHPGCVLAVVLFIVFCVVAQLSLFGELGDVRTPGIGE